MRTEEYKRKNEVCNVCTQDKKRNNPNIKGCAFRCLGNDFCDDIADKAVKYGFDKEWVLNEQKDKENA